MRYCPHGAPSATIAHSALNVIRSPTQSGGGGAVLGEGGGGGVGRVDGRGTHAGCEAERARVCERVTGRCDIAPATSVARLVRPTRVCRDTHPSRCLRL